MRITSFLAALLAGLLLSAFAARAASQDEVLAQLRQFRYGGDTGVLTNVQNMVAAVTARAGDADGREALAAALASVLETDASYEAKQFVCRQLAIIGTARQVPILAKLLTDEQFSDMARYALGPIPDPSVDAVLRQALEQTSGKVQIGILNTLGFRRDRAAARELGKLLAAADPATVQAAAAALGRLGSARDAAMLTSAWRQARPESRFPIADALFACLEHFVVRGRGDEAVPIYQELFQAGQPSQVRVAALRGLVNASGTGGVRYAMAALRDADPLVKRAAIGCVQMLPGSDATRQFAAQLPNLAPSDQVVLLGALANRGDAAALPAARNAADRGDAQVRLAALAALGKLGDASVVDLLVSVAGKGGSEGDVALTSLQTLGGEGTEEAIVKQLENSPTAVRAQLVRVLADRQAVDSVPALLRTAADSSERVSLESFRALGQLAAAANLPDLLHLLARAQTDATREAAEAAVVEVSRQVPDESKQAEPVLAALREAPPEPVRCSLLRVLGGIGNEPALAALQSALADGSAPVKDAAVRALADWPNPADTEAVLGVLQHTQDPTQRILLLRGLARLMGLETKRTPAQTLAICQQVIQQAQGPDETRQALSLLATVHDPSVLPLIEPSLKDAAVREEAAMAAVKVAGPIASAHPDLARQAIQEVLAVSQNATVKQQANAVLQELEKDEDFITAWQLAGPFFENGKNAHDLFNVAFPPEQAGNNAVTWRRVAARRGSPVIDLMTLVGGTQRAAYLRAWIHSDQAQPARLELGSDDGVKAWLNGFVVHANNADRGLKVGEDEVPVTLKAGWNSLLLKITQGEGGWGACARMRDPNGQRLAHVRFQATPPK